MTVRVVGQCPARLGDLQCSLIRHPGKSHWSWRDGWLHPWREADDVWRNVALNGGDQERDSPAALRTH